MDLDLRAARQASVDRAAELGIKIPAHLPLLEPEMRVRERNEVVDRLLAMHAVAAAAYGLDKIKARTWLDRENAAHALSNPEREFLAQGGSATDGFKLQIEGMWALAWALRIVVELDFEEECSDDFVTMLPDLRRLEPAGDLRRKASLRPAAEIVAACDLAYCLHWAVVEDGVAGTHLASQVSGASIMERRRALEWLLSTGEWTEISLDT